MYIVYLYKNTKNSKVYIGQTSQELKQRAGSNGCNYRECRRFYNAIQEDGWSSFVPHILYRTDTLEDAYNMEKYYIQYYNSCDEKYGYNIELGGKSGVTSNDTKCIISTKARERYTDPTKNPMFGKCHTEESKRKQSIKKIGCNNPMFGSVWNDKQRQAVCHRRPPSFTEQTKERQRQVGRTLGSLRKKSVVCLDDNLIFQSVNEAALYYHVAPSTLVGHLRGHQKTCANKRFEYIHSCSSLTTIPQGSTSEMNTDGSDGRCVSSDDIV